MSIDLRALKQLYDYRNNVGEMSPDVIELLCRNKLMSYKKSGALIVTKKGWALTRSITHLSAELTRGLPIYDRNTFGSMDEHTKYVWDRGNIGRFSYITNGDIVLFGATPTQFTVGGAKNLLLLDLLLSSIIDRVRFSDFFRVYPTCYQRDNYFTSGLVWLTSGSELFPIQESYYDLVVHHWKAVKTPSTFVAVTINDTYIVLLNPYCQGRAACDVISVIALCDTEANAKIPPPSFLKIPI